MNHVMSIARKELRAYFLSPIALIFLATFAFVTLFAFLWVETFFARNIADVRPLFTWLPRLLIFLCAALTMRLWSEEQKLGTLELLLTLPVETSKLVLGKFLAAWALVGVALLLTVHVPVAVAFTADLDWGPVVGGYLAAMLVAAAYLAIGLCISAVTENQIIALIFSALTCALFYVVGTDAVTSSVGNRGAEILEALGTGSRFESVRRGVIDVRDLVYYGSITVAFLVLNTLILQAKGWSQGARTRARRTNATVLAALVGANLLLLNVWLYSVGFLRLDLTENREYSISDTTKKMLRELPEPLLIRGYFSGKTHPLLAPLVPRIRDMITEYGVVSKGQVRTEFVDPREDVELEKEANQTYGIKSFPFRIADRRDVEVVNSYFSILVKYGDQHEVLSFDELIEVQASGPGNVEVKLRNLEYDVTRAVKKVAYGFQSLESMFAEQKETIELLAFITPATLPENFKTLPELVEKVAKDIGKDAGGKFKYQPIDPDAPGSGVTRQDLAQKYGFKPFAASLFSQDTFYMHLLLKAGDHLERLVFQDSLTEADLKKEITAAVQRATPGFMKTVGLWKPVEEPIQDPRMPGRPPQQMPETTNLLKKQIGENYTVQEVDLKDGRVPGNIDVLLLYSPKDFDEKQRYAVDQYLMRGGTVIVLAGKYDLDPMSHEGIQLRKNTMGLEDLLAAYGVSVEDKLVLDPQNESFPIPVVRDLGGGIRIRDIQLVNYPFFVDVRRDGMDDDNQAVAGLPGVTMHWTSPISVTTPAAGEGEAPKRQVSTLLRSSGKAWTQAGTEAQPDFDKFGKEGFGPQGAEQKAYDLAVAVKGSFESYFKDKPSPLFGGEGDGQGDRTGRTIKRSPDDTRLVVVGSASFANDMVLQISRQTGGDRFLSNLQFLANLVDWSLEDTDLLAIRSRGTFARTLPNLESKTRTQFEIALYAFPVLALGALVLFTAGRRRRMKPMELDPGSASKVRPEGAVGGPSVAV